MGQMRVHRTGPWVKISCPFSWVQFSHGVGHGVGQAVDPHFDPHHFQRFCNKKAPKAEVFDAFWSCWADSNCRPHPYQGCALPTELQQQVATTKGLEPSTSGSSSQRSFARFLKIFLNMTGTAALSDRYAGRHRTAHTIPWENRRPASCNRIGSAG